MLECWIGYKNGLHELNGLDYDNFQTMDLVDDSRHIREKDSFMKVYVMLN